MVVLITIQVEGFTRLLSGNSIHWNKKSGSWESSYFLAFLVWALDVFSFRRFLFFFTSCSAITFSVLRTPIVWCLCLYPLLEGPAVASADVLVFIFSKNILAISVISVFFLGGSTLRFDNGRSRGRSSSFSLARVILALGSVTSVRLSRGYRLIFCISKEGRWSKLIIFNHSHIERKNPRGPESTVFKGFIPAQTLDSRSANCNFCSRDSLPHHGFSMLH